MGWQLVCLEQLAGLDLLLQLPNSQSVARCHTHTSSHAHAALVFAYLHKSQQ